jgi:excisionase family DNA binding protein
MAQKYYNSADAAKVLGISVDDVKKMLDRRELHGYRDGADWKFKVEDIDRAAAERASEISAAPAQEDGGDVLLSEVALGPAEAGASGTVIAMDGMGRGGPDSDIQLVGGGERPAEPKTPAAKKKDEVGSKVSQFEELNLSLDDDLSLGDSSPTLRNIPSIGGSGLSGSAIDLSGRGLEDDDLVLGGSGAGSDVSIGGDSGISLVDPADSGLSLEQPLALGPAGGESLELGEGDMLAAGAPAKPEGDSDFLLTPLEEAADTEGSESGSQVIALDTEADQAAMMDASGGASMAAMLDEDLSSQPTLDMGISPPLGGGPLLGPQPVGVSEGAPIMQPGAVLPEAPYSGLQIAGLATCVVLLMLCGMMTYDLLRNMWSWQEPYAINSSLMDAILSLFGAK